MTAESSQEALAQLERLAPHKRGGRGMGAVRASPHLDSSKWLRRSADQPQLHCLIRAAIRQAQIRLLHSDPKMGLAVVWDPRVGVAGLWELHETTVSK
jgi:hypothetical protein